MENCFICDKHEGLNEASDYYVYGNDIISVYHMPPSDDKIYLGYLFIELNRHIGELDEMTIDEASEVGKFQRYLSIVFKESYCVEHVYVFMFGDGIAHIHYHILPRYIGAPKEFRGIKVDEWMDAPHGNGDDVKLFCKNYGELLCEVIRRGT